MQNSHTNGWTNKQIGKIENFLIMNKDEKKTTHKTGIYFMMAVVNES